MKRINKFCIVPCAFCIALLTSCQSDDLAPAAFDPAVRITTTMTDARTVTRADADARTDAATRAANTYPGTDLSLSIDYGTGDDPYDPYASDTQNNVKWTTTTATGAGNNWTPEAQMFWRNPFDPARIYAYAPYVDLYGGSIEATPFSVQRNQNVEGQLLKSDLVGYITTGYTPGATGAPVPIVFSHRLAKLTINLTLGNQFDGAAPTIASASLQSVFISGTYNATTGAFVTHTDAEPEPDPENPDTDPTDPNAPARTAIAMHRATTATTPAGIVATYEVIFPPQTIAGSEAMIDVTLADGTSYRYTAPASGHTFGPANAYTMNLRVGYDKLTLSSVTVEDWDAETEIGGGEAVVPEPIQANAATHTVTSGAAGQLTEKLAADPAYLDAIVSTTADETQGTLLLKGPMNEADITALKTWALSHIDPESGNAKDAYALRHLDMSGVTGMEKLPDEALGNFTATNAIRTLVSIALPTSLKEIGTYAFMRCTALTTVSGLSNVSTIGVRAFMYCSALDLGEDSLSKVVSIGQDAFNACTSLTAVDAPVMTSVGHWVFQGCTSLTTVTLGKLAAIADNYMIFGSTNIGTLSLPACTSLGKLSVADATIGTLRLTTSSSITMHDQAFFGFPNQGSNTILVLHENKKPGGGATPQVTTDGKWGKYGSSDDNLCLWKKIIYVDDDGKEVVETP